MEDHSCNDLFGKVVLPQGVNELPCRRPAPLPAQMPPSLGAQVGASPALSGSAPWVALASTCSQITRELSAESRRKNPAGAMR